METTLTLGQRVYDLKGHLSLRKLAESANMQASELSRICTGAKTPRLYEIHRIARALNTTAPLLIEGTTAQNIAWGTSSSSAMERLLIEAEDRAGDADGEARISFARLKAEVHGGKRYDSQELEITIHDLLIRCKDLEFANHGLKDLNSDLSNLIRALSDEIIEVRKEHRQAVAITRRFVEALSEEDPSQAPLFVGLLNKLEPTLHVKRLLHEKEETNEVDKGYGFPQAYSVFDTGCAGRNDGNGLCAEGIPDGLQGDSDLC